MRYRFPGRLSIFVAALIAFSSSVHSDVPSLEDGRGDPLVRIMGLTPVASTQLTLGTSVTVEATIAYILQDAKGKVGLTIIDDSKHAIAMTSTDVTEGKGEATLKVSFVVPASKMLTVKGLLLTSEGRPFARDSRTYTNIFAGPMAPQETAQDRKKKKK